MKKKKVRGNFNSHIAPKIISNYDEYQDDRSLSSQMS